MSNRLTEDNIRKIWCKRLRKRKTSVVISKWKRVHLGRDILHKEQKLSPLFGEFDVVIFRRRRSDGKYNLQVIGYEIKGCRWDFKRRRYEVPNIKEGMGQALSYLSNGADFAYVVRPQPKSKRESNQLIQMFEERASKIGLLFVTRNFRFRLVKYPVHNNRADEFRKIKMLAFVLTTAADINRNESIIPDWAYPYTSG